MGFHDWLRLSTERRQLAGVRFWPHDAAALSPEVAEGKEYLEWCEGRKGIIVWFGDEKTVRRLR
jgi:hypothetical protein